MRVLGFRVASGVQSVVFGNPCVFREALQVEKVQSAISYQFSPNWLWGYIATYAEINYITDIFMTPFGEPYDWKVVVVMFLSFPNNRVCHLLVLPLHLEGILG